MRMLLKPLLSLNHVANSLEKMLVHFKDVFTLQKPRNTIFRANKYLVALVYFLSLH